MGETHRLERHVEEDALHEHLLNETRQRRWRQSSTIFDDQERPVQHHFHHKIRFAEVGLHQTMTQ